MRPPSGTAGCSRPPHRRSELVGSLRVSCWHAVIRKYAASAIVPADRPRSVLDKAGIVSKMGARILDRALRRNDFEE